MKMEDVPLFGYTVDKSQVLRRKRFPKGATIKYYFLQVPPIHQKRILAFVNHFIISTCSFLNDFALKCEARFVDVERKLQKVEASLIIIESKLSSIPDLENKTQNAPVAVQVQNNQESQVEGSDNIEIQKEAIEEVPAQVQAPEGVKASEDARYRKYFKMMQFGVPPNAVKIKMQAEGFDPDILDTPDAILPDGVTPENVET